MKPLLYGCVVLTLFACAVVAVDLDGCRRGYLQVGTVKENPFFCRKIKEALRFSLVGLFEPQSGGTFREDALTCSWGAGTRRYSCRNRGSQSGTGSAALAGYMFDCRAYGKSNGLFRTTVARSHIPADGNGTIASVVVQSKDGSEVVYAVFAGRHKGRKAVAFEFDVTSSKHGPYKSIPFGQFFRYLECELLYQESVPDTLA